MTTTRTAKVESDIEKIKVKIGDFQSKLKELEQKKTEIENTEIVDIVRGLKIPLEELAPLLHTIRSGSTSSMSTSGPKAKKSAINETEDNKS